ncbi:SurA N-terminal domain-containing protein [Cognatishimia sp. 1_MG-2023]|uniref:peptidyl-prolyl cis-trans isomerase n=1 Tax=Cognatishimia sp. 1_MG-2023 TaxID=3062642 RepID=UPI0026E3C8CD|nr:SurA N-terminal domain-containing protein [Cognatishimia sp. 1_MG-2023]MDO6727317.1 SurA N-terminal domain-containing protein [Cognatishimia sp. 1_MG-2023]
MSEKKSISKTLMWILMGLLIFGLGGFGITNLGGAVQTVGSVSGKPIDVNEYYRAVQQELSAIQQQAGQRITFAQAQQFGLDQQVLGRLVTERALDGEAERLGLSMGDENLRDQILTIPAFQNLSGAFDRESYRFALQNSGLTETEFENSLREDAARTLLQSAVIGGIEMPESYADALVAYLGERRSFSIATLTEANLDAEIAAPDEAALRAYYDANIDAFMQPATRDITYVWITPAMLLDTVDVDEEALRKEYEARDAEFNQPERRLVERLVFGTSEDATAALAQVTGGETSFEALVEARGLTLQDVDMGDVTQESLVDNGALIFGAESGDVVGPAQTDLGPALFRVNAVLAAQSVSFDEAEPMLRDALAMDRARRVIDAQINEVDDLLAGGASLEEVAEESDLVLGSVNFHANSEGEIAGYDDFRRVAQIVTAEDFPEVEQLDDGGIFALRLDGTTEAAPTPFDDAKAEVEAAWRAAEVQTALKAQAEALTEKMAAGADIVTLGLNVVQESELTRGDFVPNTPAGMMDIVFDMTAGEVRSLPGDAQYLIVELDSIDAADLESTENASIRNVVSQQVSQALAQDIFNAYSNHIRSTSDIEIDQHALAAVNAQLQ